MINQLDAIVVGADAAGLSAARVLQESGLTVRVLEAKNRIGGRALTDRESFAVPFDHGCAWLSAGDYNPLLKLAIEEGRRMEARFFPTANTKTFLEDHWATEDEESEKNCFLSACECALREAAESGLDVAWTDLIDAKSPWMPYLNGRSERDGATTSACSTLDVARNQGSGELLFVFDGYGSLIETLGEGIPIELEAEVDRIDWSGEGVVIRSSKGEFSSSTAIAYIFGERAIEIERMSESDALDFILARLEKVFGSGIRDRVVHSSRTQWGCDPHVLGSYAAALPGRSDARGRAGAQRQAVGHLGRIHAHVHDRPAK